MARRDFLFLSQSEITSAGESNLNEQLQLNEPIQRMGMRKSTTSRRKRFKDLAPPVQAEIPDMLRRTKNNDYVAKYVGATATETLAGAVIYLLEKDWLQRNAAIHGFLRRVA